MTILVFPLDMTIDPIIPLILDEMPITLLHMLLPLTIDAIVMISHPIEKEILETQGIEK